MDFCLLELYPLDTYVVYVALGSLDRVLRPKASREDRTPSITTNRSAETWIFRVAI